VEKFIAERIISHGDLDDGTRVVRVRWHGYDNSADTWEPTSEIPMSFVRRYARRWKLALSGVLPMELMPDEREASRRMTKPSQEPPVPTAHALFLYSQL
jgi:Chromo (CHRromatin Organisation MOdifier) domain